MLCNFHYLENSSNSLLDLESTYFITYDGMTTDRLKADQFNKGQVEEIYKKCSKKRCDFVWYIRREHNRTRIQQSTAPRKYVRRIENKTFAIKILLFVITIDEDYYKLNIPIKLEQAFRIETSTKIVKETNVLVGPYFKKYFQIGIQSIINI